MSAEWREEGSLETVPGVEGGETAAGEAGEAERRAGEVALLSAREFASEIMEDVRLRDGVRRIFPCCCGCRWSSLILSAVSVVIFNK